MEVSVEREEAYKEIEEVFAPVPSMFKVVPDSSLELERRLFKRVRFDEGPIPNKYRELIGVAILGLLRRLMRNSPSRSTTASE